MTEVALLRLKDIRICISDIRRMLRDKTLEDLRDDRVLRAAFERFLVVISEASRGVPPEWQAEIAPELPWRNIAMIGNHLRHAYFRVNLDTLWNIYMDELTPLENAVEAMIARYGG